MTTIQSTVFLSAPPIDLDDDTQPIVPVHVFEIVLTVESDNPYLNGRQTRQPMLVTRDIAEMMFHQTVTIYEDSPGGGPYRKIGDWKYRGRHAGEMVTLELIGAQ